MKINIVSCLSSGFEVRAFQYEYSNSNAIHLLRLICLFQMKMISSAVVFVANIPPPLGFSVFLTVCSRIFELEPVLAPLTKASTWPARNRYRER